MTLGLFDDEVAEPEPLVKTPAASAPKSSAPAPKPSAPVLLSDDELLATAPTDPLGEGLWRMWRAIHGIDKKLAKRYRTHDTVDRKELARLVNAILFGVESDRPELTLDRLDRVQTALAHLPRYIAHLRVGGGQKWTPVLKG